MIVAGTAELQEGDHEEVLGEAKPQADSAVGKSWFVSAEGRALWLEQSGQWRAVEAELREVVRGHDRSGFTG